MNSLKQKFGNLESFFRLIKNSFHSAGSASANFDICSALDILISYLFKFSNKSSNRLSNLSNDSCFIHKKFSNLLTQTFLLLLLSYQLSLAQLFKFSRLLFSCSSNILITISLLNGLVQKLFLA
ncbi:hypothetical protein HanIR_Chr03g0107371 [Helianthus annuus]|nr:hypothetical protein HanIR_Chr03g0107371 [Helianthus annuus]